MATLPPAHPRKEEREDDSEKDVKEFRLQWRRYIFAFFCVVAALRVTWDIKEYGECHPAVAPAPEATQSQGVIDTAPITIVATPDANTASWYMTPPSPPKDAPTRIIVCADPGPGPTTYVIHVNHDPTRVFTPDDLMSGDLTSLQFVGDRAVKVWAQTVKRSSNPDTWCK